MRADRPPKPADVDKGEPKGGSDNSDDDRPPVGGEGTGGGYGPSDFSLPSSDGASQPGGDANRGHRGPEAPDPQPPPADHTGFSGERVMIAIGGREGVGAFAVASGGEGKATIATSAGAAPSGGEVGADSGQSQKQSHRARWAEGRPALELESKGRRARPAQSTLAGGDRRRRQGTR